MIATAPITSTPTTPAMMNTGTCRLLIFSDCEPFGSKMFCGVSLSEHADQDQGEKAERNERAHSHHARSPHGAHASRRVLGLGIAHSTVTEPTMSPPSPSTISLYTPGFGRYAVSTWRAGPSTAPVSI